MNLVNGDVLSFETEDPSMVFATHIANAWEEGEEEVVFDLATNPWDAMAEYLDRDTMLHHPHTESDLAGQVRLVPFCKNFNLLFNHFRS